MSGKSPRGSRSRPNQTDVELADPLKKPLYCGQPTARPRAVLIAAAADHFVGPRVIFWSRDPATAEVRWNRLGRALR